jgi:hypothetical protein
MPVSGEEDAEGIMIRYILGAVLGAAIGAGIGYIGRVSGCG